MNQECSYKILHVVLNLLNYHEDHSKCSEVKIRIKSMQPQFRGRRLNMRNFDDNSFVELGILIGNKVEEDFSLIIDHILLK